MSGFIYVVTEGVHDVTFLGKLLGREHGAQQIKTLDALDETHRPWLETFKWPTKVPTKKGGEDVQISRLSVPAPVFYRLGDGRTVTFRNAEGIDKIFATIERDKEFFGREGISLDVVGVVLDSDNEPPVSRFQRMCASLRSVGLSEPAVLGGVIAGPPRVGVFSLPEPAIQGTLEDLLLALGVAAYPALCAGAETYAKGWQVQAGLDPNNKEWGDLRKPAGLKKATLAAMTAILKPGRAIQASLEDHRWVSDATNNVPALKACVAFLRDLLATSGPPLDPIAPVEADRPGAG